MAVKSLNEKRAMQISYLRAEKTHAREAQKKAEELRDKLELYKSVEDVINGSMAEVNNRLHEIGDFSNASRQLSCLIVMLKKELNEQRRENESLRQEYRKVSARQLQLRKRAEEDSRLRPQIAALQADLRHTEEAKSELELKLGKLQEALDKRHQGEERTSVAKKVRRLEETSESQDELMEMEVETQNAPSASLPPLKRSQEDAFISRTKSFSGSSKKKVACDDSTNLPLSQFNIMKKGRLTSAASTSTVSSQQDLFYDGFGGHSKPDNFPQPLRRDSKAATKQKTKATVKQKASSAKMNTINKYFTFDTP